MRARAWASSHEHVRVLPREQVGEYDALLSEMGEAGCLPNVVSFSAAISACDKGGEWERALALLESYDHIEHSVDTCVGSDSNAGRPRLLC